jgi:hypothetical protein
MKALGVQEEDLSSGKKGSLIKSALAWYVHRSVLTSHKWISGRLHMGCPSNLTVHMNRFKNAAAGEPLRLRKKLDQA